MSEISRNLFVEVERLLRKKSLTSQLGNLNRFQCGHVKDCLETLSRSRKELEPIPEICEELYRIVQHAKCLLRDCSNEEERLNAVISLADPRETFVKILFELQWCMALMPTFVRLNERRHSKDRQLQILKEFVNADWISMVKHVRCSVEEAWVKDREELRHKLENLQRDPQRRCSNPEEKARVLQKLLQRLSTDADDFLCEIQPGELTHISKRGYGGSGLVYHSKWLGENCASKKIENHNESFQREAAVLSGLCHPNVVQLFGRSVQRECSWLVMELMSKDLKCLIDDRQNIDCSGVSFPLLVALDILLQIAEGMQYLHAKNIAHRDIKPKNLLVNPVGTPELDARGYFYLKIADFGDAKNMKHSSTASGANKGTTPYMAPEVIAIPANCYSEDGLGPERRNPQKADVYSFGVTAVHILTGVEAYSGVLWSEIRRRVKYGGMRPELPAAGFPPLLISLINRCWIQAHERPSFAQICLELRHLKGLVMLCAGDPQLEALMFSIHPNEEEPERASMYQAYLKAVSSPRAEVTTSVTNVLVVGDKGAGKTHFIKKLCGQDIADDNKSNLKGSAIPDINQEWRHPSLPCVFHDSKDLGHDAADIDHITKILNHRNKGWGYVASQALAFNVLRRGFSEEHGQDLKNLNSDRIHLVWIVLSALESPQTQWIRLMDLIERFELPVQLLTMKTEQDPSGEKLKGDLDKYWYLFAPSTPHQQTRCLENVNAEQLWATSQEVITKHQIQITAKIISRLAFRLGKNGITIASAPFINLTGDYSLSQTGLFIVRYLCKFWEVPHTIEVVLWDRLVSLERDESLSRTSSRRNLESRIPSSNLDSVRPSPADESRQLKLEPGRFLGFGIRVAKLIIFLRARHPMGWLQERRVQDRRYALELVNSYDGAHGANLEFDMSPYHFGVFSKITNKFVDVSGKRTLEENLRVFLEVFFKDMLNCLPEPCPVVVAEEEVPGNRSDCESIVSGPPDGASHPQILQAVVMVIKPLVSLWSQFRIVDFFFQHCKHVVPMRLWRSRRKSSLTLLVD